MIRGLIAAIGITTAGVALATPATAQPDCGDSPCRYSQDTGGDDQAGDGGGALVDWGIYPYVTVCAGVDTAIPFVGGEICTG